MDCNFTTFLLFTFSDEGDIAELWFEVNKYAPRLNNSKKSSSINQGFEDEKKMDSTPSNPLVSRPQKHQKYHMEPMQY